MGREMELPGKPIPHRLRIQRQLAGDFLWPAWIALSGSLGPRLRHHRPLFGEQQRRRDRRHDAGRWTDGPDPRCGKSSERYLPSHGRRCLRRHDDRAGVEIEVRLVCRRFVRGSNADSQGLGPPLHVLCDRHDRRGSLAKSCRPWLIRRRLRAKKRWIRSNAF